MPPPSMLNAKILRSRAISRRAHPSIEKSPSRGVNGMNSPREIHSPAKDPKSPATFLETLCLVIMFSRIRLGFAPLRRERRHVVNGGENPRISGGACCPDQ